MMATTAALAVSAPLMPAPMPFASPASLATAVSLATTPSFAAPAASLATLLACRDDFGPDGIGIDTTAQH